MPFRFLTGSAKQWLAIWLAVALAVGPVKALAGSMTLLGVGKTSAAAGCSQATTFIARTSGLSGTDQTNYTNLICGLVTDGVFSKLDFLYIFATNTVTTAKLNLISTSYSPATYSGTPSEGTQFSAFHGYTGDGSTVFISSITAPGSGNYTQDSASYGMYVVAGTGIPDDVVAIGMGAGGVFADIAEVRPTPEALFRVNVTGGNFSVYSNSSRPGMYISTRTGASATAGYKNGSSQVSDTTSSSSIAGLPAFYILARNDNGTASSWTTDQLGAAFSGAGLSGTDAFNLSCRINTFMTAYSINAYANSGCP